MRVITQSVYSVLSYDLNAEMPSDRLFPTLARLYTSVTVFLTTTFFCGMGSEFFNLLTAFYFGVSLDRRPPWERQDAGRSARKDHSSLFRYF
jgi:hypothetical protein